jgi:hypothetical protein
MRHVVRPGDAQANTPIHEDTHEQTETGYARTRTPPMSRTRTICGSAVRCCCRQAPYSASADRAASATPLAAGSGARPACSASLTRHNSYGGGMGWGEIQSLSCMLSVTVSDANASVISVPVMIMIVHHLGPQTTPAVARLHAVE